MNSLTLGFFYILGLTWLLCEVSLSASTGNWTPLWLYLAGFSIMFAVLGCLPISTKAVETAGPVFAILIGACLLLYGFAAFESGLLGGMLRCLGGLGMIAIGVLGYSTRRTEAH